MTRVRSRRAPICSNFETDGSSNSLSFSLKHLCTFRRVSCTFGHSLACPEEFKFARIFMLIDESANSPFVWLVSLMFYRALFKILNSPRLSNPLKFGPSGKLKHRQESDKNNKLPVNYRLRKTRNQRKQSKNVIRMVCKRVSHPIFWKNINYAALGRYFLNFFIHQCW